MPWGGCWRTDFRPATTAPRRRWSWPDLIGLKKLGHAGNFAADVAGTGHTVLTDAGGGRTSADSCQVEKADSAVATPAAIVTIKSSSVTSGAAVASAAAT